MENIGEEEILQKIAEEKNLLTRLDLCKVLQQGDEETALLIVKHLGEIGSNQYVKEKLPLFGILKKTYPLPRDVLARTLGKMNPCVFSVIKLAFQYYAKSMEEDVTLEDSALSELLDAAGYMVFSNQKLANAENIAVIDDVICLIVQNSEEKFKALICWKYVICLSAFRSEETVDFAKERLSQIADFYKNTTWEKLFESETKNALTLIDSLQNVDYLNQSTF